MTVGRHTLLLWHCRKGAYIKGCISQSTSEGKDNTHKHVFQSAQVAKPVRKHTASHNCRQTITLGKVRLSLVYEYQNPFQEEKNPHPNPPTLCRISAVRPEETNSNWSGPGPSLWMSTVWNLCLCPGLVFTEFLCSGNKRLHRKQTAQRLGFLMTNKLSTALETPVIIFNLTAPCRVNSIDTKQMSGLETNTHFPRCKIDTHQLLS